MLALAPQIVAAVYQHGKFTPDDTALVSGMLSLFGIGIFAWCLHPVLMRGFFALHNSWLPILIGTGTTALFVALILLAQAAGFDHSALPLASSTCAIALVIALALAMRLRIGPFGLGATLVTLLKATVASAAIGLPLWLAATHWGDSLGLRGKVGALLMLVVAGCVGGWIYYGLTKAMKMPEIEYVKRALRRRAPVEEGALDDRASEDPG
jgi:putative peptidoglycan lipid II flippase